MARRFAVIMAGGSGERFWPLSRPGRPKQLLKLTDPDATMLEQAVQRMVPLMGDDGVYVATSAPLREAVLDAAVVEPSMVLTEPAKRNTLGAQCWIIAQLLAAGHDDCSVAILTADHWIGDADRFRGCVSGALDVAEDAGGIVTLGIPPTRPETGYGYIEEGSNESVATRDGRVAKRSKSFREKPSPETAQEFVEAGTFLWNGGMFFYTLPNFLAELERTQPEAHAITLRVAEAIKADDLSLATKEFEQIHNISVDYAVMERAERVYVLRTDFDWDDVGSWDAMERTMPRNEQGNVLQGDGILIDTADSIVINDLPGTIVGVIGVEHLVVVATENAVLVCPKSEAQRVRLITQAIANR